MSVYSELWVPRSGLLVRRGHGDETPPDPPARKLIIGASSGYESISSLNTKSSAVMDVNRYFDGGFSTAFGDSASVGNRGTIYSIKADVAALAANNATEVAKVRTWRDNIPLGHYVWASLFHEPEDNHTTSTAKSQYRTAWQRFHDLMHETNRPEIKTIWIMMAYSWTNGSGRNPLDWYPGDQYVDVIGVDSYNEGSRNNPQRWDSWGLGLGLPEPGESLAPKGGGYVQGGFVNWCSDHGKQFIVTEWGCIVNHNAATPAWCTNRGIPATKEAWIEYSIDWFADIPHCLGVTYFNSVGRKWDGDPNESWTLNYGAPATYEAWGRAVNKWRTGTLV